MKTMEELRIEQEQKKKDKETERLRLDELVLVAEVSFPVEMAKDLGISGFHMKLNELESFLEDEFENENQGFFAVKIKKKTNKWIEHLPEADI